METEDIEPQELSSDEEEGEEEEEGAAPSVVESSVVVLEEVITPRRECAFPRAVKTSMNAVAPVTCLMKLAEMQNPPPHGASARVPLAGEVLHPRLLGGAG